MYLELVEGGSSLGDSGDSTILSKPLTCGL